MHREHSATWLYVMWSLGIPWFWDMWNVDRVWRHWNYLNKCNVKECGKTLSSLLGCWLHALVQQHFSKEGMFMNRFSEGVVSLISLWVAALLTSMPIVGAYRSHRVFNKMPRCNLVCWNLLHILNRCYKKVCEDGLDHFHCPSFSL
jgi:hypothetical protein